MPCKTGIHGRSDESDGCEYDGGNNSPEAYNFDNDCQTKNEAPNPADDEYEIAD